MVKENEQSLVHRKEMTKWGTEISAALGTIPFITKIHSKNGR